MTSIETIIDSFIAEHELVDEIKEPIIDLINQCMNGICRQLLSEKIPEATGAVVTKSKSQKVLKADKIEDPSTVESREELHNCTTGILNQFCKDSGLKVGGNKAVIMDRVWRHLQGTSSDEDKSSRSKTKVSKKVTEKHACCGFNSKGAPCGLAANEQSGEKWFCFRHIVDVSETLKSKAESKVEPKVESEDEDEPEITPVKVVKTKTVAKTTKKVSKAAFIASELVTDDEE